MDHLGNLNFLIDISEVPCLCPLMDDMQASQLLRLLQPSLPSPLLHLLSTLPSETARYLWLRWLLLVISQEMTSDGHPSEYHLQGRPIPQKIAQVCLEHLLIPTALLAMAHWMDGEERADDQDLQMLARLQVSAFDVALMIETVMRAESQGSFLNLPSLPGAFLLKLQRWEAHLVAWGVWQEDKIFTLLSVDEIEGGKQRRRRRSLSMPPTPRTPPPPSCRVPKSSPLKALESMTGADGVEELSGEKLRLQVLLRKYLRLAAATLDRLCHSLMLPGECCSLGWKLLLQVMDREISLFRNRHLIQFLIMIVYSVGKLSDHPLTFTQIITAMRAEPLLQMGGERLYRRIPMASGSPVDIVHLYNHEFLPRMRDRIYSLKDDPFSTPMPSSISPSHHHPLTPDSLVTISPSPLKDQLSHHRSPQTPSKIIHLSQDLTMPCVKEEPENLEDEDAAVRKVARRLFFE